MLAFPKDLARVIKSRWDNVASGDYETPQCPKLSLLTSLLEVAYLSASAPEEGRFPEFNIVAVPRGKGIDTNHLVRTWPLNYPRPLIVAELRALAPAVDLQKSAILVDWAEDWQISGLVDLGTSWHRARMGLEYNYDHPACLLIQIHRPGRIRVYQGAFHVATLTDGTIRSGTVTLNTFLHQTDCEFPRSSAREMDCD